MTSITLRVNGDDISTDVAPRTHLADFVREELHLTGTHIGCEHGVCGACTMIVDGRPIRSCLSYAVACAGADVRTVEAFDGDPVMGLLRGAFSRYHALQCGYCTPGMLATAYDIVTRLPNADDARVREELSGNLCRCTGYVGIIAAIRDVLASGPHTSAAPASARTTPASTTAWASQPTRPGATATAGVPARSVAARTIEGGVTLKRLIAVPMPVDRLWHVLQDIETIARCLPGASIDSVAPNGDVTGAFDATIGPMRAQFGGTARVTFDTVRRSGAVQGAGGDSLSRSRADGAITFAALAEGEQQSSLDLTLTYKLSGPLAQLGRPTVVASVVDQVLANFAANLVQVAQGGALAAAPPVSAFRFLFGAVSAMLRRPFSRP